MNVQVTQVHVRIIKQSLCSDAGRKPEVCDPPIAVFSPTANPAEKNGTRKMNVQVTQVHVRIIKQSLCSDAVRKPEGRNSLAQRVSAGNVEIMTEPARAAPCYVREHHYQDDQASQKLKLSKP